MKIRLCDNSLVDGFDFFYFFLIMFYTAQITPVTSRMVAGLSSPWIPFLIPLILTLVLMVKYKVSLFDKRFVLLVLICLAWDVAVTFSKHLFSLSEQSYQFFLFYAVFVAFVQIRSFGKKMVPLYESVIVTLCKISLLFWVLSITLQGPMRAFASLFPESELGNNILFIYNYINPVNTDPGQYLRNSGCSWEPGRFSVMISLGIFCNLLRNGVKFRGNHNVLWMMVALLSTMSTTGYSIVIVMYAITIMGKSRPVAKLGYLCVLVPLVVYLFSLDFMGAKIKSQLDVESFGEEQIENMDYYQKEYGEDEYLGSLERFEAMFFEFQNVIHDPLFGYGRNVKHSYFRESYGMNFALTGGLVQVLGMYGLLLGLLFYVILFRSSLRFAEIYPGTTKAMLFIVLLLSSVSYMIFTIPIFTAFWLYDWFADDEDEEESEEDLESEDAGMIEA